VNFIQNVLESIGHTPLIRLNRVTSRVKALVLAKVETYNPGLSIKDRIALRIVESAEKRGVLKVGGTIIECTSGNTGIGLAMAAAVKGYRCVCTVSDKQSKEKIQMLRAWGAEVIVCPAKVKPEDPRSYYAVAERLSKEIPNSFWVNQYDNPDNPQTHYETTGPEIWEQTQGRITHFIAPAGTGGSLCGVARFLKEKNPNIQVWGIDAFGSVLKKYHETEIYDEKEIYEYSMEGVGREFIPRNMDFSVIDKFEKVTDKDAALMARRMVREEGLWLGHSSGAAVQGVLQLEKDLKEDDIVVVLCHDHGSRYMGKIYNDDWMREKGFLTDETDEDKIEKAILQEENETPQYHAYRQEGLSEYKDMILQKKTTLKRMDLFEKRLATPGPLGKYAEMAEGYFMFPKLEGELGNRMKFQGKEKIVWSLNNYLGLANHPEVRKADADAAAEWGLAYPMGARMMSGETNFHNQLEAELAEFVSKESSYLLNYGYQGILSIIDALLDRRDVVVYDKDCHACIMDGIRMHLGERFAFEHNDAQSLENQLLKAERAADKTGGGILVITEGVFGMRGEQGILRECVALKKKYDFRLLVDDAHGFGTLGATGSGAGEEQGVQDDIDLYFSTFAKSMASIGAFVAGDKDIITFLKYNLRSQIFAKSLPMPLVIGALKRLELLRNHPELREKLWENVTLLQDGLKAMGFNLGNTSTCVTPVFMRGEVEEALQLVSDLRENYHIFCSIVVYPVIPRGMMLLRLIPTAVHTKEDIDLTLHAFGEVAQKLKSGVYAVAQTVEN
jgi:glycine C-acetyltransferase